MSPCSHQQTEISEAAQAWGELEDGARAALASAAVLVPQVEAAAAREADIATEAEAAARCAVSAGCRTSMIHRLSACVQMQTLYSTRLLAGALCTVFPEHVLAVLGSKAPILMPLDFALLCSVAAEVGAAAAAAHPAAEDAVAAARAAVAALRGRGADVALADLHALAHARLAAWRMEHPDAADFEVRVPCGSELVCSCC